MFAVSNYNYCNLVQVGTYKVLKKQQSLGAVVLSKQSIMTAYFLVSSCRLCTIDCPSHRTDFIDSDATFCILISLTGFCFSCC